LSPYVASDSTRVRQSSLSLGFHLSLYLLTASWLLYRAGESDWTSGTHVALVLTASWVLIGPMLVVTWEARLDRLQRLLDTSDEFEVDHAEA
ncbi:MAG: hypothetical protein HZB15_02145, partial [Actinobacteria bacterium]|nr:hypothetical protein [Actinomycetota bacterium]